MGDRSGGHGLLYPYAGTPFCVLRVNSRGESWRSLCAQHTYTRKWMVIPPPSARVTPQRDAGSAAPAVRIAASPQCLPTTRGYARFSKARRRNHP